MRPQPKAKPATLRAGIYCRLSKDPHQDKASIGRQEADARALAALKGWSVTEVYVDRDLSASKEEVTRPAFERLKADCLTGRLDVVVVWKWDRLSRLHLVSEMFRRDADKAGVKLVSVMEPDQGDATSDLTRRILSIVAEQESRNTSMRVKSAIEAAARAGKYHSGGMRAFGYTRDRSAVVPEEAKLIAEAADRILAGDSIRAILRDWEARGMNRCSSGKPWGPSYLSRALRNPLYAGLRTHHGEVVAKGTWPVIIPKAKWDKLQRVLRDPERRTVESTARTYLLNGLLYCAKCKQKLTSRPWISPKGERRPRYVCAKIPGTPACGGVCQSAIQLDEFIKGIIIRPGPLGKSLGGVLRGAVAKGNASTDFLLEQIAADEAQLQELADMYAAREIGKAEWQRARSTVSERLEQSQRALAELSGMGFLATVPKDAAELAKRWEFSDLAWRRRLVFACLERIEIGQKAKRTSNGFDADRVSVIWRPLG